MKKYILILISIAFVACKSGVNTDFRDDFRGVNDAEKKEFLKKNNGLSEERSILLLTQGFKGEKIIIKQKDKNIYSSYPITNLNTRIADYLSFNNQSDIMVYDNYTKQEIIIGTKNAKKYKFIYLKKEYKGEVVKFKITFSNTLRPLE